MEELFLGVMHTMQTVYGVMPKELWNLSKKTDLVAPRAFKVNSISTFHIFSLRHRYASQSYPIVSLKIEEGISPDKLEGGITVPHGIRSVTIGKYVSGPITLPAGIEKLIVNSDIENLKLPGSLKELKLGDAFRAAVDLPPELRRFTSGTKWNSPVILPLTVKYVELGRSFNYPLTLPTGIQEVRFASDSAFNQKLEVPNTVKRLFLGSGFASSIVLPEGIVELGFGGSFNPSVLPRSVKRLKITSKVDVVLNLPEGLEEVEFVGQGNSKPPLTLPKSLKVLKFAPEHSFSEPLALHEGLQKLWLSDAYNESVSLPSTSTEARFGERFKKRVIFSLALKSLTWDSSRALDVPRGLKHLTFGQNYRGEVFLPDGLETLTCKCVPDHRLVLPSTLKSISIARLPRETVLPDGCTWVKIPECHFGYY